GVEGGGAELWRSAAAAEGEADAGAAGVHVVDAGDEVPLEDAAAPAALHERAVACVVAAVLVEVVDEVAAHHPAVAGVDVELGHRPIGVARRGVRDLAVLDEPAVRDLGPSGAGVDLELGVE